MNIIEVLTRYNQAFVSGFYVTLQLFTTACLVGTLLGVMLGALCHKGPVWIRKLFSGFSFSITAIPTLVILFWLHFPLQSALNIVIPPFYTAAFTLLIINTVAVARLLLDTLEEFPSQYLDAARVCGMRKGPVMLHILLPLVSRMALPRWLDQQVAIFHATIFGSLISVEEIFRVSQRVNSEAYQPIAIYSAMALFFLCTAGPALWVAKRMKSHYSRDFSER